MPYTLGGLYFQNKKAVISYAQKILANYKVGQELQGLDFKFVRALVDLHPEAKLKIGCGVAAIKLHVPALWNRGRCASKSFLIVRPDGSTEGFSYKKCIAPPSHRTRFIEACRTAVYFQVVEYRKKTFKEQANKQGQVFCPYEQRWICNMEADVDHVIPFTELIDDFLSCKGLDLNTIPLAQVKDDSHIQLVDSNLEREWVEYHRQHAKLQIISSRANVRKGNKKELCQLD